MAAETREMREAGDELDKGMGHRFGAELACIGCGVTWLKHFRLPEECQSTPMATDRRPVVKWVRAAARRGDSVREIARRYQLRQAMVEEMIGKEGI